MQYLTTLLLLTTLLSCTDKIKGQATRSSLTLPDLSVTDASFPLNLSILNLKDKKNIIHLNDDIESKIKQTIYAYYFDVCMGDSSETQFKVRDIYVGTIRLHDTFQTLFLILFNHIPGGEVNSKVLFYDNQAKVFCDSLFDFNLHALYDTNNGKLKPSNLKQELKINSPEIELVDFDKDGRNEFKFTRLFHDGTANAIETAILKVANNRLDTLDFEQIWKED